ncbi:MAG: STAS domain-containing protein [Leptospiraceae bacterium]|nr:STAS domain-containing protein [Leptospiraceae bacterium]MCP5495057.1 STAS domain-containing protein [Leptospiraceae bacterium]
MEMNLSNLGNVKIIGLTGKFDIESTEEFEENFQRELKSKPPAIAIDMTKLDYIDSSGIGALIKSLNSIKNNKGVLILFGLKSMILNIFKLAKLDLFFQIMTTDAFHAKYGQKDDSDIDDLLKKKM